MKRMKKALALLLALVLLLTLAACGKKDKDGTDKGGSTDAAATTTTTTNTTTATTEELLPDDERDGSEELPFEIGGVLEFDAVVKANGITYYDVYRVGGTDLTIESADAYVMYDGKTYEPEDGVITFPVTTDDINNPVKLAIGNKGTADATFKVTFAYPKGTLSNPIELTMGDLTTDIKAGNETGVVYTYTATAAGYLTIVGKSAAKGVDYDIELYNLTSGANRTLLADGENNAVCVTVAVGDEVRVTYMVLPNEKNEYLAATITSVVEVSTEDSGSTGEDDPKETTYTVTVKDGEGNPVSGVKLQFDIGGKTLSAATDSKGGAKAALPTADGTVTLTVPSGYIAEKFTYTITAASPALTITLEKEQSALPDDPVDPDDPEPTTVDYTVTLLDGKGNPMGGLPVSFYSGDTQVAQQTGDKKGVSTVTLDGGTYTVKVGGTELHYDEKVAVVSAGKPNLTLILAPDYDTSESLKVLDPLTDKLVKTYYLPEGAVYVPLTAGERNYFLFEPTRGGTYRFAASNTYAKIGYYGASDFVMQFNLAEDITSGNAFNISVTEGQIGNIFVIGIDAATNCTAAVLQVTRIGDPAWDVTQEPWVDYAGNGTPKNYIYTGGNLVKFDITASADYKLVYNDTDGYYHLNSKNGPVVLVQLGSKAPYVSIQSLLTEFGNMGAYLYNPDGTFLRKEQYAPLMQEYVNKMDKSRGVYPLTKDLEYMLRNYGEGQNWWNAGEPGYLFEDVVGVNSNNAWMFLFCYAEE